jgi:membrane protein DedA with SNARE-associated domain
MDTNTILMYIHAHGYIIIFLFLFFGIVGIPAPEESLLFLLGVLIAHQQLAWEYCLFAGLLGVNAGMLSAYGAGFFLGHPFINKYGKYVGINKDRWHKADAAFRKYGRWTILFGYYLPGIRQISPYMAGMTNFPFVPFLLLSCIGSLLWTLPFVLLGAFFGERFNFPLSYIPLIGLGMFVLFILGVWLNQMIKKKQYGNR